MSIYKISDLENLTGIKAHTIRIWEQRYNILLPLRTETNIRFYNDEHLKKLLNIVSLIKAGSKISKISKLSIEEISKRVAVLTDNAISSGVKEEALINQMISAGLTYNEKAFEKYFSNAILSFGLLLAYQRVFYPMLCKIGLLWSTSELNPSQEHFVSNLIKQKLFSAIDSVKASQSETESWLLFLPAKDQHDLGLLVSNYGLRLKGHKVYYLGADVPLTSLMLILEEVKPSHCLMFSVMLHQEIVVNKYLRELNMLHPRLIVNVCCSQFLSEKLTLNRNQNTITTFEDFKEII